MRKQKEILIEAVNSLYKFANIRAVILDDKQNYGAYLEIMGEKFVVKIITEISRGNKGIVLADLKEVTRQNNHPILLVTKYIPDEIAKEYVGEGINCLDIAGNCNIRQNNLFLLIEGKKMERMAKVKQPRAFQEAGIKLIFQFLVNPEKTQLPFRELAELANISLGSVSMIMQELIELNFILKTKQTRKLKNMKELLNRWITSYHDVMRPRLIKNQMRFVNQESYNQWKAINLASINPATYWGGEPAANLLTGYLHPGTFTIYTNQDWHAFKGIDLVPDANGKVEILDMFWTKQTYEGVPPILVYADLMGIGNNRNIETAQLIFNNELQYIK